MTTEIRIFVHLTIIVMTSLLFSVFLESQIIVIGLILMILYLGFYLLSKKIEK
jgi:hypothetical protein